MPSKKIDPNKYNSLAVKPLSFKIFIVVISITMVDLIAATILSYYQADKKYAMITAFIMFIALAFTTVGIYSGIRYNAEIKKNVILNRIGLVGNLLIFLYTIGLMAYAAFTTAAQ